MVHSDLNLKTAITIAHLLNTVERINPTLLNTTALSSIDYLYNRYQAV